MYQFGASEEAYKVSFPTLTPPFKGGWGALPSTVPAMGSVSSARREPYYSFFSPNAASSSLFAPSANALPLRAFRPLIDRTEDINGKRTLSPHWKKFTA